MRNERRLAVSLVLALAWVLTSLPVATANTVTGVTYDTDGSTPLSGVTVVVMNTTPQALKTTTSASDGSYSVSFTPAGGGGQPPLGSDNQIVVQFTRQNGTTSVNFRNLSGLATTTKLNPVVPQ